MFYEAVFRALQKERVRFRHAGRKDRIPASLADLIRDVEEETEDHDRFTLQMALDYGGKDEVLRAVSSYLKTSGRPDIQTFTEENLRAHLDQPDLPDIDLIVRTSGEVRTSNFFLWQSAYAEWYFSDKFFPDFGTQELAIALTEYNERKRRFGG